MYPNLESEGLWFKGMSGQLGLEVEESSVRLSPKADRVQGPYNVLIRILYFICRANEDQSEIETSDLIINL